MKLFYLIKTKSLFRSSCLRVFVVHHLVYLLAAACAIAAAGGSVSCKKPRASTTTAGATVTTPRARAAYVTNNGSDTISVLDRDGTAVTDVAIDIDPSTHEAPHHLAVDGAGGTLFVALAFPAPPTRAKDPRDPHASHGNAEDRGKIARLDLASLAVNETREVDENPGDIVLTHDRARVLVTHFDMKRAMNVAAAGGAASKMFASLQLWDTRTMALVGSRALCVAPHGMAITPDDRAALVACYGSDELAVVDLTSPSLPSARYPLGAAPGVPGAPTYGPYSATLAPDGNRIVVADLEGMDVRVFDRNEKRFLAEKTVSLGARAFMPAFVDAKTLLVPLQSPDGLARIDIDAASIDKRATFHDECKSPHVVSVAKDARVYLVCEGDHVAPGAVVQIDPVSLAIVKRWTVGIYPDGIAFGD
jgi:DNA-binding beta-propeller fold protein YncE